MILAILGGSFVGIWLFFASKDYNDEQVHD